jgi:hypothetical protein
MATMRERAAAAAEARLAGMAPEAAFDLTSDGPAPAGSSSAAAATPMDTDESGDEGDVQDTGSSSAAPFFDLTADSPMRPGPSTSARDNGVSRGGPAHGKSAMGFAEWWGAPGGAAGDALGGTWGEAVPRSALGKNGRGGGGGGGSSIDLTSDTPMRAPATDGDGDFAKWLASRCEDCESAPANPGYPYCTDCYEQRRQRVAVPCSGCGAAPANPGFSMCEGCFQARARPRHP